MTKTLKTDTYRNKTLAKEIDKRRKNRDNKPRGRKHSEESKKKLSLAHKGKKLTAEHKKKLSESHRGEKHYNYGKHRSEKTKKKISETKKALFKENKLKGGFRKNHKINIGRKHSEETKRKIGLKGDKNPSWKGGITPIRTKIWRSKKYSQWRQSVFKRDNYTCQKCKIRGSYLEAHHIKQFAYYPNLRFDIDNGATLCRNCHNLTKGGWSTKSKTSNIISYRRKNDKNISIGNFHNPDSIRSHH